MSTDLQAVYSYQVTLIGELTLLSSCNYIYRAKTTNQHQLNMLFESDILMIDSINEDKAKYRLFLNCMPRMASIKIGQNIIGIH